MHQSLIYHFEQLSSINSLTYMLQHIRLLIAILPKGYSLFISVQV